MDAKERALVYLKTKSCYANLEYLRIDDCIKPIVRWMNAKGYITLHSCAGHEDKGGAQRNYWYIWFVATTSVSYIRKKIQKMKHPIELVRAPHHFLKRSWILYTWIEPRTNSAIAKRNKEIFRYLTQKSERKAWHA